MTMPRIPQPASTTPLLPDEPALPRKFRAALVYLAFAGSRKAIAELHAADDAAPVGRHHRKVTGPVIWPTDDDHQTPAGGAL